MPDHGGDRLSVALVGFGGAGSGIHRPLITAHPRLSLDTVVTRHTEGAEQARLRCPDAHITTDLSEASRCAVAVVAIPPLYRAQVVGQLLESGVHVVVEKPLGASLEEAESIANGDSTQRLTIFQNRRWDSDFLTMRRLQSEQVWVGPARLESRLKWWQPAVRDSWRNRRRGGGILLEVGSHLIDQALRLLGPATSVYAELDTRRPGADAEDDVFLALRHADGSRSHLSMGPLGERGSCRFELTAADVRIRLGASDRQQDQLAAGMAPGSGEWGLPDAVDWVLQQGDQPPESIRAERGRWQAFYDGVVDWVAAAGRPPVPVEEAVATMRVIDAARRSHDEVRVTHLTERR